MTTNTTLPDCPRCGMNELMMYEFPAYWLKCLHCGWWSDVVRINRGKPEETVNEAMHRVVNLARKATP